MTTAVQLHRMTVAELRTAVKKVDKVSVLKGALENEQRSSAIKVLGVRIEELETENTLFDEACVAASETKDERRRSMGDAGIGGSFTTPAKVGKKTFRVTVTRTS